MMGYGGKNESMWTNNTSYFERTRFGGQSTFGKDKDVLHLKMVCWMNPYAVIEHVPEDWSEFNVAIYHAYGLRFSMDNTLNIYVISMSQIDKKDAEWTKLWSTSWPLPGHIDQPKEKIIREEITDL